MTLTEFLLARIAEDEEAAKGTTEAPWQVVGDEVLSSVSALNVASHCEGAYRMFPKDAAHIARHDPARVLAECEAKRRIVRGHPGPHPCTTLLFLAAIFANHPDYLPEWKP